jgi:hypothetical protein
MEKKQPGYGKKEKRRQISRPAFSSFIFKKFMENKFIFLHL